MNLRRILPSILAASILLPALTVPARAQSGSTTSHSEAGNNTENNNPTPAPCCSCIGMVVHGVVEDSEAGIKRVKPDSDGGYQAQATALLIPKPPEGTTCNGEYPVTITATLRSQGIKVSVQSKSTTAPGGTLTFDLPADVGRMGDEWEFTITCGGSASDQGSGSLPEGESINATEGCSSVTLTLGGCESCASGHCSQTGQTDTKSSSFTVNIPSTVAAGGTAEGSLDFYTPNFANPGPGALLANVPASFAVARDAQGTITSVDTGAATLTVQQADAALLALDPNAFTVIHKDPTGTPFRTTTISFVEEAGVQRLRMDTAFEGVTIRHEQTQPVPGTLVLEKGRLNAGTFEPLWQETLVKSEAQPGVRVHRRTVRERAVATDPFVATSDIESTWEKQIRGWVRTKEIIDPSSASLTSTWTYYQPGEITGPNGAIEGLGRLKHHVRYDGYESFHTYALNQATVTTPHEGDPAGRLETVTWNPANKTKTTVISVAGVPIEKSVVSHTATSQTRVVHTSESDTLTSITHYVPSTQDFGGRPLKTLHPDGTLTTYTYTRHPGGGFTTVTETGSSTDSSTVTRGTRTTTTVNSRGTPILRQTTAIGYDTGNAVFDSWAVTSVDNLGRPLATAYHPTSVALTGESASATGAVWTTTTSYSCCGVAQETDMYGIPTFHAYDGLQRRIKTHRMGVTLETQHQGLTTNTYRYPETVTNSLSSALNGTAATLVGKSVTNLAGTLRESWTPDPTNPASGALVQSSSTATTYQPAPGLSARMVTTVPGDHSHTTDYFLDGRTSKTSGSLGPAMEYAYPVNATGQATSQSYDDNGTLRETTLTQTDWAGRTVSVATIDNAISSMAYNELGQLNSSTDSDAVTTLFAYNPEGERTVTAIDLNANGTIDYGTDTISFSETIPALDGTAPVYQTVSKVWQQGDTNPAAGTIVSTSRRAADGLSSSMQSIGVANPTTSLTVLAGSGNWTETTTKPDGTTTNTTHTSGLLASTTTRSTANAAIEAMTYGYDPLNRLVTTTHSRTGSSTTNYLSTTADVVVSIVDPGNRTTSFTYDLRGRRTHVDAPDTPNPTGGQYQNITITHYFPDGTVQEITGDQTYRTSYTYDYARRMETMTTYGTETATTTWNYSPQRGFLTRKQYHDGEGTDYTYTPAGRLKTRTWARGQRTRYDYDNGGRLGFTRYFTQPSADTGTNPGDDPSTPDVAITYDCLGRQTSQSNGLATSSFAYDPATLQLDSETLSYDFNGDATPDLVRVLDRSQDSLSRSSGYQLKNVSTIEATASYQYSPTTGRLESVGNGTDTFTYAYTTNSNLLASVTKSGTPTIQTTHTWEPNRNVLDVKENKVGSTVISSYDYSVNALGQRTAVDTAGSAFAAGERDRTWSYDALGQVTAESDANNTAYHRGFAYDAIGNRLSSIEGNTDPTQPGATTYTPTVLNQYTQISAPSVPSVVPTYDADGNQLASQIRPLGTSSLASCLFVWDGENRLIEIKDATGTNSLAKYTYDSQSRRIARTVGGTTLATIYDGWNPIAEYQSTTTPATAFTLHATYLWGLDLSGSMQGAGGVGGLLSVTSGSTSFYPTYDGNGNVGEYLDAAGAIAAHYEYDAFGNVIFSSGASAASFQHRFSTKPQDEESGLYYYGYRYYDPVTGRWPSRDPIEEEGGVNLYGFVGNDGVNHADFLGFHPFGRGPVDVNAILGKLDELAKIYAASDDKKKNALGEAISSVAYDIRMQVRFQGPKFQGPWAIGIRALDMWTFDSKEFTYNGSSNCNMFVAEALRTSGHPPPTVPSDSIPMKHRLPSANQWHIMVEGVSREWTVKYAVEKQGEGDGQEPEMVVTVKKELPSFGDIISYPNHIGIYLGHNIYLSSTAGPGFSEQNADRVAIKPVAEKISRKWIVRDIPSHR